MRIRTDKRAKVHWGGGPYKGIVCESWTGTPTPLLCDKVAKTFTPTLRQRDKRLWVEFKSQLFPIDMCKECKREKTP